MNMYEPKYPACVGVQRRVDWVYKVKDRQTAGKLLFGPHLYDFKGLSQITQTIRLFNFIPTFE